MSKPLSTPLSRAIARFGQTTLLMAATVFWGGQMSPPVQAQNPTPMPIDTSQQQMVMQMERRLEVEFENHFRDNLADVEQSPSEMARTLRDLNAATGTKAAVLWAIPKDDFLRLVLMTPDGEMLMLNRTDVSRATLNRTVRRFRRGLQTPHSYSVVGPAQQLYDWIVAPFAQDYLQAQGIDKILFCLGDGLRGVPMAALHDGEQFMVEQYSTTLIPAFNLIQTELQAKPTRDILAMGASEFAELSPLPAVPSELASIQAAVDQVSPVQEDFVWQVRSLLNQEFTVDTLDELLDNEVFDIVHLATHAAFSAGHPRESYIQFRNERLSLDEIDQLHWNEPPIELLVLSACQTALGSPEAELGFAGMALKAGVKSAIASLWSVSDAGTLALMTELYRQLPIAPTKAIALRQAQLQMLRGHVEFTDTTLRLPSGEIPLTQELHGLTPEDLSHPFYWASFTMVSSPW